MELFTHPNKMNPTELANEEENPDENHWDNGATTQILTQPSLLHSPPIDNQ